MTDEPGVPSPNYTQIPNMIFELMPLMNDTELRVILFIARQTFGWHKKRDKLSISQIMKATGLSNGGVIAGVEAGIERGLIRRTAISKTNARKGFYYSLLVNSVHKACELSTQALVNSVHIQKKGKETLQKKTEGADDAPPISDPKPERERDPLFDAIAEHWHTAPGQTALLKSVMLGTNKKYSLCNFSPPAAPDEVAAFVTWYRRKYPDINLPVVPEKLQSHFYAFRKSSAARGPETRWNPATQTHEHKVGGTWYSVDPVGANP